MQEHHIDQSILDEIELFYCQHGYYPTKITIGRNEAKLINNQHRIFYQGKSIKIVFPDEIN